jgi:hypothetical protein
MRDYTSQSLLHRPVFSVTLLPTADVPLLPGSRPRRLATIPYQPHTLTADCRLTAGLFRGPLICPRHGPHRKCHFQQFLYCHLHICCYGNVFPQPLPCNGCFSGATILAVRPHVTVCNYEYNTQYQYTIQNISHGCHVNIFHH